MKVIHLILLAFLVLCSPLLIAQQNNPLADNKAVVISGNARFTVLTSQLIRMEWSDKAEFEDRASLVFINRKLEVPAFKVKDSKNELIITTDKFKLIYKKDGKFTKDNLTITFSINDKKILWFPGLKDDKNLSGTSRTLDGVFTEADVKLEDGLISRNGFALIDDSKRHLFDASDWKWLMPRTDTNCIDWYFFAHGHEYKKALKDYTLVAGKIPLPPRFAFGYWWSRYWDYSDEEFRTLVKDFKTNNIPIDVLIIDMEWHNTWGIGTSKEKRDQFGEPIGWTGYSWNHNLFPDPDRFLKWTEKVDLKTALNLHPASGIAPFEDCYNRFAKAYDFDTTGRPYIPFKIEEKKWAQTYFNEVLQPMEKSGVDFWWLDWQQWLENKGLKGLSNTWWLNYTFFTNMERRGEKRPMLFHRWGGLGNHRYQIGFSGDAASTWETLNYETYFTSTASNVCYGYWSHDIGGHMGNDKDPELYLRWLQFGAYSPILRTHCTKGGATERRFWKYPDHFEMMRQAVNTRYQLEPYIYQHARKAYDDGISICRPMYYEYPETEYAYSFKNQYFFGNDLIVAPIATKADPLTALSEKEIWLPEGEWFEMHSGRILKGNQVIKKKFAMNEVPVYAKAGSIIPMNPPVSNLSKNPDTLIVVFIPGNNNTLLNYYEDDGSTSAYQKEEFCTTNIYKKMPNDSLVTVLIDKTNGSFKGMSLKKAYQLQFPNCMPPKYVIVNSKEYKYNYEGGENTWNYDGKTLSLIINIPLADRDSKFIEISFNSTGLPNNKKSILDGKKEFFSRIEKIAEDFKTESCNMNGPSNPPESFLYAAGLATNITYFPDKILYLLNKYEQNKKMMFSEIVNFSMITDEKLYYWFHFLGMNEDLMPQPLLNYRKESENIATYSIHSDFPNATIHYTTDGNKPDLNSAVYKSAFKVMAPTTVRAITSETSHLNSLISNSTFVYNPVKKCTYSNAVSEKYTGGSDTALFDGKMGNTENFRTRWAGVEKKDFILQCELKKPLLINELDVRFLYKPWSWIMLPDEILVEISADGINYEIAARFKPAVTDKNTAENIQMYTIPFTTLKTCSFLRFTAKTTGKLPKWHDFAGQDAWLFIDEIMLKW
ncbi:MAG: TIM-barrel domain-containing protein [Bacteroidales bacterium]